LSGQEVNEPPPAVPPEEGALLQPPTPPAEEPATSTATTTEPALGPTEGDDSESGEVLGTTTPETAPQEPATDEGEATSSEDEIAVPPEALPDAGEEEASDQPIISGPPPRPQEPPLSHRELQRDVIVDATAAHRCEAEQFRIDVSGKSVEHANILLHPSADAPHDVEIGGLPEGIDIRFAGDDGYLYHADTNDASLPLDIRNQDGSQKGDFTVSVIYTQKGAEDSSVVCQINVVNS
jgi:hypothetical protein